MRIRGGGGNPSNPSNLSRENRATRIARIARIAIIDFGTQLLQKLGLESQLLGFGQSEQSEQFEHSESPICRPPIHEL